MLMKTLGNDVNRPDFAGDDTEAGIRRLLTSEDTGGESLIDRASSTHALPEDPGACLNSLVMKTVTMVMAGNPQ